MEAVFCVDCLEDALRIHGKPEIFNSVQGAQFTSAAFIGVLEREKIVISMDGRGRVFDNIFVERLWRNVKYEDVYLKGYATIGELIVGLTKYFVFYNGERPLQALADKTPDEVYRTAQAGGALIVDKFYARWINPLFRHAPRRIPSPQRPAQQQHQKQHQQPSQKQNRGNAIPLRAGSNAQLKFSAVLS